MTPINFKLINLLNSLSRSEIKEFKKFISSGLYASGRNYLPLLNHLLKYKLTDLDNLYVRDVYSKLYPGKKFSKQTLKNRFSELYKLGEEFLVYLGINEDKMEKEKILLKMLIEKKLYNTFEGKYKKIYEALNLEKYDKKKFTNITAISDLNMNFMAANKKISAWFIQYFEDSHLRLCTYLISLFETGFEFLLQEYDDRMYEYNHILDFLRKLDIAELMNSFSKSNSFNYKVTAMNYYLYKAFEDGNNEEHYFKSHKLFTELSENMKEDYKILKFNQMIHYSIKKQNEGIKKFKYELFNLYNEKLNQGLFSDLQNIIYLANNFRDYVFIGISIKKYKWVEDFVKKYSKELPEDFRQDEINLSNAKLNIAHKNYEKSLLNLNSINANNYLLYLDSSVLKLCCYYELAMYEDAFMELDRIKHYIRNHKEIPKAHVAPNSNFIRVYQKLLKAATAPSEKDIGFLGKEVHSYIAISKRDWILEKINDIIN